MEGVRLMLRSIVSDDLRREYEWLHYCNRFLVPGSEDLIVQGVWDQWPDVPPGQRQVEVFLDGAAPRNGDRVLDVGCGMGGLARACLEASPELESVTGVDINAEHIRAAKANVGAAGKASFYTADAAGLSSVTDPALARSLDLGFDRIYMMELSQDLNLAQFDAILAAATARLRDGGVLAMIVLSMDAPPATFLEKMIGEMVVRKGAPTLAEMRASLARLGYEVSEEDVTTVSSRALVSRVVDDPSIARKMLPWPLSAVFLQALRVGLGLADRGAYSVTKITASQVVAHHQQQLTPAGSVVAPAT